jgi:hypothetical protein
LSAGFSCAIEETIKTVNTETNTIRKGYIRILAFIFNLPMKWYEV